MTYSTWTLIRWFRRIFYEVRVQSAINATNGILRVGLDFAFIWATKLAIDAATQQGHDCWLFGRPATLFEAGVIIILIMIAQFAISYAARWIEALLGVESQNKMQRRIFGHLLKSKWHGKEERHSGDVLNRLEGDCQTVVSVATDTIPQALTVGVRLVAAFFFLFSMDATLALCVVSIMPVFILLSRLYIRRMRAITREVRQTDSRIQAVLQESIQHRLVLKTLERIPTMMSTLTGLQDTLRAQVRRRTLFSSNSNLILNIGFGGAYLFTFLWSANRLAEGTITFGMMTAFIQLCGQIQGPFRDMTRFIPTIIGSFTAAERLIELEEAPLESTGDAIYFKNGAGIRLTDVSFAYTDHSRKVIDALSYDFPPGSSTAIMGETGAGKTTLIRLVLALLSPNKGKVEMYAPDGEICIPVSTRTRCNLVYVPQGNSLFSGTIRYNLAMGNPDADEATMLEALRLACADFVQRLPNGLDTVVGEGGAGISEGQAQRIAIARALLREGSILLLDEATSALDLTTEKQLLENLIAHNAKRTEPVTMLFITHRSAVIEHCSQVMTLQKVHAS